MENDIQKIEIIEKIEKSVACCMAIRNCAKFLDKIFLNLDLLSEIFTNFNVICVYDNCSDNTEELLIKYKEKSKFNVFLYHNINNTDSARTVRIANSRNMCLNIMNSNLNVDFHFVIDADNVNILKWDINIIKYYLNTDDWDCLTFNRHYYYDIWALLFDDFKHHCWGFNSYGLHNNIVNYIQKNIVNKLKKINNYELLECHSAFNGFAIYRTNKFNNILYNGTYKECKTLISDNERMITLNKIKKELNNYSISIDEKCIECCEHIYYHLSAIRNNNARIRISNKYYYSFNLNYFCIRNLFF